MKALIVTLILMVFVGLGIYIFFPKCKQPSTPIIQLISYQCTVSVDIEKLRDRVCSKLKKSSGCSLSDEDMPTIEQTIKDVNYECVKEKLEDKDMCTDKVKETIDGIYKGIVE